MSKNTLALLLFIAVLVVACQNKREDLNQQIVVKNDLLKLVVKSKGAELISIQDSKQNKEFLWQGDSSIWADHAIIQFPIIGNAKHNEISFKGLKYPIMSHGFARVSNFQLINYQDSLAQFQLESGKNTKLHYPFDFRFLVSYSLDSNRVHVRFRVENTGLDTLFFSLGYHPGFICNYEADEYYLEFSESEKVNRYFLENELINNQSEPFLTNENAVALSRQLFAEGAIILSDLKSKQVTIKSKSHSEYLKIDFGKTPYFGIWSPKEKGNFVCLEPWFGIPDKMESQNDLDKKLGIMTLPPTLFFDWECVITVGF